MNRSFRKRNHKTLKFTLAKNTYTRTSEADLLPTNPTSTTHFNICGNIYKKDQKINRQCGATKRLNIKPRHESTPLNIRKNHENSGRSCEELIENLTPIRTKDKSSRSLEKGSASLRELTNRMCKSDSNVPSQLCSGSSANQMLSLDETFLRSVDLECVEGKLMDCDNEASLQRNSECPDRLAENKFPDAFAEGSEENCDLNDTSDVCLDDLDNIDIDNWVNDSFTEGVLNSSKCNNTAADVFKTTMVSKRAIQCDNKSPVVNKKQKSSDDVICDKNPNCQNKHKDIANNRRATKHNVPDRASLQSGNDTLTAGNNNLSKIIKETIDTGEESTKNQPNSIEDDHIQNKTLSKDSSDDKNTSRLSVVEKVRRMLVTNAQKPVTSRPKTSDMPSAAETENFRKLGPFFGLPSDVRTLFEKHKGICKLYDWQEECLSLKAVNEKRNLVYALPTSGGKTLVAEILLLRELLCYKKDALFVLPYVAIVQEKVHSLSSFAIDLGFRVEEYAAGKGQYPPKKQRRKQSVYVATIEKAHSLINSMIESKRLSEIGLVIVDELHLLGEGDRGATLECLLTKLLVCPEKIHIVGMSATIGNLAEVAKFLCAEVYLNNFRPVELKEYIKCEDTLWAVNNNEEDLFAKVRKIDPPYTENMRKLDPDKVCSLVLEVVPEYSCLVFCPTKSNCENLASLFVKIMPKELLEIKKEERAALYRALLNDGRGSVCSVLTKCVPYGVAYHHSGLTGDERRLLEEAYRAGTLCCICCTSTLAAGVNLPAKRVILRAPFVGARFISLSQYKQMVGRAGRAGFDASGESILVCQQRDMERVNALLRSHMDNACSQLHVSTSRGLQSLVLSSIGLAIANCRKDLHKIASFTLLHVQKTKLEVKSNELVDRTIINLFKLGALKVESTASSSNANDTMNDCQHEEADLSFNMTHPGEKHSKVAGSGSKLKKKRFNIERNTCLKISRLGRASMKGPIDLRRTPELYKDLVQAQTSMVLLSYLHLLYLISPYDMMDQIKPDPDVYFSVYNSLSTKDMQTAHVLGISPACMLKVMKGSKSYNISERIVHRFYITLILSDLWNQCTIWDVSRKYNLPRGTIQTLMTSAASFASCVMHFCEELSEFWAFKELLGGFVQRLSHCCSADLIQLMELPAVKTGRARQLYNAGYKTLLDVANASATALTSSIDHLPRKVANQIIAAAKLLLLTRAESLREEAEEIVEGMFCKS